MKTTATNEKVTYRTLIFGTLLILGAILMIGSVDYVINNILNLIF